MAQHSSPVKTGSDTAISGGYLVLTRLAGACPAARRRTRNALHPFTIVHDHVVLTKGPSIVTPAARVLVSAFTPSEKAHLPCKALLGEVRQSQTSIILPTLVIVEIAAAIGRGQGKPDLGYAFAMEVVRFPNLMPVNLDESLAQAAAEIAARYRLRGSDAVYVAVARRFGTTLVTPGAGIG